MSRFVIIMVFLYLFVQSAFAGSPITDNQRLENVVVERFEIDDLNEDEAMMKVYLTEANGKSGDYVVVAGQVVSLDAPTLLKILEVSKEHSIEVTLKVDEEGVVKSASLPDVFGNAYSDYQVMRPEFNIPWPDDPWENEVRMGRIANLTVYYNDGKWYAVVNVVAEKNRATVKLKFYFYTSAYYRGTPIIAVAGAGKGAAVPGNPSHRHWAPKVTIPLDLIVTAYLKEEPIGFKVELARGNVSKLTTFRILE